MIICSHIISTSWSHIVNSINLLDGTSVTYADLPVTTKPCLLTANGRQARVFQQKFWGSNPSTLRKTTLSSSPPTATTISLVPANTQQSETWQSPPSLVPANTQQSETWQSPPSLLCLQTHSSQKHDSHHHLSCACKHTAVRNMTVTTISLVPANTKQSETWQSPPSLLCLQTQSSQKHDSHHHLSCACKHTAVRNMTVTTISLVPANTQQSETWQSPPSLLCLQTHGSQKHDSHHHLSCACKHTTDRNMTVTTISLWLQTHSSQKHDSHHHLSCACKHMAVRNMTVTTISLVPANTQQTETWQSPPSLCDCKHTAVRNMTVTTISLVPANTQQSETWQSPPSLLCLQTHSSQKHDSHHHLSCACKHTAVRNMTVTTISLVPANTKQSETWQSPPSLLCLQTQSSQKHDSHHHLSCACKHTAVRNMTVTTISLVPANTQQSETWQSPPSLLCLQTHGSQKHDSHHHLSCACKHTTDRNMTVTTISLVPANTWQSETWQSPPSLLCLQTHNRQKHDSHHHLSCACKHMAVRNMTVTTISLVTANTQQSETWQSPPSLLCLQTHSSQKHDSHHHLSCDCKHTAVRNMTVTTISLVPANTQQSETWQSPPSLLCLQTHSSQKHDSHHHLSCACKHTAVRNMTVTTISLVPANTQQSETWQSPPPLLWLQTHSSQKHDSHHHLSCDCKHKAVRNMTVTTISLVPANTKQSETWQSPPSLLCLQTHSSQKHDSHHHLSCACKHTAVRNMTVTTISLVPANTQQSETWQSPPPLLWLQTHSSQKHDSHHHLSCDCKHKAVRNMTVTTISLVPANTKQSETWQSPPSLLCLQTHSSQKHDSHHHLSCACKHTAVRNMTVTTISLVPANTWQSETWQSPPSLLCLQTHGSQTHDSHHHLSCACKHTAVRNMTVTTISLVTANTQQSETWQSPPSLLCLQTHGSQKHDSHHHLSCACKHMAVRHMTVTTTSLVPANTWQSDTWQSPPSLLCLQTHGSQTHDSHHHLSCACKHTAVRNMTVTTTSIVPANTQQSETWQSPPPLLCLQTHSSQKHDSHHHLSCACKHTAVRKMTVTTISLVPANTQQSEKWQSPPSLLCLQTHSSQKNDSHHHLSCACKHTAVRNTTVTTISLVTANTQQSETWQSPPSFLCLQTHSSQKHDSHHHLSCDCKHTAVRNMTVTTISLVPANTWQSETWQSPPSLLCLQTHGSQKHDSHHHLSCACKHTAVRNMTVTTISLVPANTQQSETWQSPPSLLCLQTHGSQKCDSPHHLSCDCKHTAVRNVTVPTISLVTANTQQSETWQSPPSLLWLQTHSSQKHDSHHHLSCACKHTAVRNMTVTTISLVPANTWQSEMWQSPPSLLWLQTYSSQKCDSPHHLSCDCKHTAVRNMTVTTISLVTANTQQSETWQSPPSLLWLQTHGSQKCDSPHHLSCDCKHMAVRNMTVTTISLVPANTWQSDTWQSPPPLLCLQTHGSQKHDSHHHLSCACKHTAVRHMTVTTTSLVPANTQQSETWQSPPPLLCLQTYSSQKHDSHHHLYCACKHTAVRNMTVTTISLVPANTQQSDTWQSPPSLLWLQTHSSQKHDSHHHLSCACKHTAVRNMTVTTISLVTANTQQSETWQSPPSLLWLQTHSSQKHDSHHNVLPEAFLDLVKS